jgi:hypothetical protein
LNSTLFLISTDSPIDHDIYPLYALLICSQYDLITRERIVLSKVFFRFYSYKLTMLATHGYWKDLSNQRQFFDQVATELSLKSLEDWYKVKQEDVIKRGGSTLLSHYYGGSLKRACILTCSISTYDILDFAIEKLIEIYAIVLEILLQHYSSLIRLLQCCNRISNTISSNL